VVCGCGEERKRLACLIKFIIRKFSGEQTKTANAELYLSRKHHRWIGRVLRHYGLLHEIIEHRMSGKPTRGKIQMLHDLANDGGFVALIRGS